MTAYLIEGAKLLGPSGLEDAALLLENGVIAEIGAPPRSGAVVLDGRGLIAAPAMVDIHGDAFERQVSPRPGVFFPMDVALLDTDRQLAACGIATACHALTLSWAPGLRSVARGAAFVEALETMRSRFSVEHRVQLRWETFAHEALPLIERALRSAPTPSVAFNDHTSMSLRSFEIPLIERAFEQSPEFETADFDDPRLLLRLAKDAQRAGLAPEAYRALLLEQWARRGEVDADIRAVAAMARAAGAAMLSHDDTRDETRGYYRALGARVAEFPQSEAVARRAREAGDAIVLGAPNALRGGSHIGAVGAADMVEAGLCDALASDYAYPAMLAAAGRLVAERRAPLERAWSCVSAGPARALGLDDRGTLRAGLRADVVLLDWPEQGAPAVRATFSAGRLAFLGADLLRGA